MSGTRETQPMTIETRPKPRVQKINYSIGEAAAALSVSEKTLRSHVKSGAIPHFRMGERILFPVDRLREWANLQPESR
jgi:excisionase family DNA binding protein